MRKKDHEVITSTYSGVTQLDQMTSYDYKGHMIEDKGHRFSLKKQVHFGAFLKACHKNRFFRKRTFKFYFVRVPMQQDPINITEHKKLKKNVLDLSL